MAGRSTQAQVREAAGELLGFDGLRPGQEAAMAAAVAGRDVLTVLPTGGGKSAVYQVAGALLPGATLVVSPLIALQHDQVERIGDELGGAALVNSSVTRSRRQAALDGTADGEIEFLFLAPEQLANEDTLAEVLAVAPSLVVVDEAEGREALLDAVATEAQADSVTVLFDDAGYRTLSVELVEEHDLLRPCAGG